MINILFWIIIGAVVLWQFICFIHCLTIKRNNYIIVQVSTGIFGLLHKTFITIKGVLTYLYRYIVYIPVRYNYKLCLENDCGIEIFSSISHKWVYIKRCYLKNYKFGYEYRDKLEENYGIIYKWLSLEKLEKKDGKLISKYITDKEREYIKEKFYIDKK